MRMLLPEIVKAHEEGIIHFHDADYYAQHMHNCDLVNLEDMLQNGTVISGTLIEKPHSFSTACNIATQIIAQVASYQYGGQSISLTHLAPFVEVSRRRFAAILRELEGTWALRPSEEEASRRGREPACATRNPRGVQTIQYQVVTLMTTNGQAPFVTVFMYLNEARSAQEKHDLASSSWRRCCASATRASRTRRACGSPRVPQAHLRAGGRQHRAGRSTLFLPHRAGRQVHRQAHGARLHLREEDARIKLSAGENRGQRRLLHLHGLPQLPDARPLGQRLDNVAHAPTTTPASPSTTAASTRASSPSTCPTWRCPPAATWTSSGRSSRSAWNCATGPCVPPRPP